MQIRRKNGTPRDELSLSNSNKFYAETTFGSDFTEKPLSKRQTQHHNPKSILLKEETTDDNSDIRKYLQERQFKALKPGLSSKTPKGAWSKPKELHDTIHEEQEIEADLKSAADSAVAVSDPHMSERKTWGEVESVLQQEMTDPRQLWSTAQPAPPARSSQRATWRKPGEDPQPFSAPSSPVKSKNTGHPGDNLVSSADAHAVRSPRGSEKTSNNPFSKYSALPRLDLSSVSARDDFVAPTEMKQEPEQVQKGSAGKSTYATLPPIAANKEKSGAVDMSASGDKRADPHPEALADPRQHWATADPVPAITVSSPSAPKTDKPQKPMSVKKREVPSDPRLSWPVTAVDAKASHQEPTNSEPADPRHPRLLPSAAQMSVVMSHGYQEENPRRTKPIQPSKHMVIEKRQSLRPRSSNIFKLGYRTEWSTNYRNDFQKREALTSRPAGAMHAATPLSLGTDEPEAVSWRDVMPARKVTHVYP